MKKIVLLVVVLFVYVMNMYAQSEICVIFTSTQSEVKGVRHYISPKDSKRFCDRVHIFTLLDRTNKAQKYSYVFVYTPLRSEDLVFLRDTTFLKEVPLIDWDKVSSKQEAESLYESILSCDRIYFIDRTETVDGKLKVYPVKKMETGDVLIDKYAME